MRRLVANSRMSGEAMSRGSNLLVGRGVLHLEDLPLGTVDASVIAAAERLGVTEVATVDRRHFGVVRAQHVDAFTLLP